MRKRTWLSLWLQLMTASEMNREFGTMTSMLSLVWMDVLLARMEVRVLIEEMRRRRMVLESRGDAVRAPSNFVHGILSVEMGASSV